MRKFKNILILAGGDSTRFWPLTEKNLIDFIGQPLIIHHINTLKNLGHKITVVVSPQNYDLMIGIIKDKDIQIVVQEDIEGGMAGAILASKNKISGEVLILNASDLINAESIKTLIDKTNKNDLDFVFFARKVKKYFPGGYLILNKNKVVGIEEKPAPDKVPSDLINLVVDYFSDFNIILKALQETKGKNDDWYEQAQTKLIETVKTDYIIYDDYWYCLKYPCHVLKMMKFFLGKINEIKIGRNVKIAKTAVLSPPVYIGDNTIIGDFCLVRQSHIGKNCLIGSYSEVARSYIGDNVSLHRNYVGDSVLSDNVLFGAGATTANFRFDQKAIRSSGMVKLGSIIGKNTKIGVNSTILPGIKIGRNCAIGPASLIGENIEDGLYVFKDKKLKNKL